MELTLSGEQARELATLVEEGLRELSHEIANTDNASFRARLSERREHLRAVAEALRAAGVEAAD